MALSPELITDDNEKANETPRAEVIALPSSPLVTTVDNEGPIVNRRELWAYYRTYDYQYCLARTPQRHFRT